MTENAQVRASWRQERLHEYYKEHQDVLSGILSRCNWEKIGYRAARPTLTSPDEIILDEEEHLQHIEAVQQDNAAVASQQSLAQPIMTQEQWLASQLTQNAAHESKELERQEKNRVRNRKKREKQRAKQLAYQKASHRPAKKQFTENRIARELDIQQHESVDVNYGLPDATSAGDTTLSNDYTRQMVSYSED